MINFKELKQLTGMSYSKMAKQIQNDLYVRTIYARSDDDISLVLNGYQLLKLSEILGISVNKLISYDLNDMKQHFESNGKIKLNDNNGFKIIKNRALLR